MHLQAAKAVAAVDSTGPADDGSSDELPPLPAWQQQALAALQLAGPGANTEVTIRWQSAPAAGAGSCGGKGAASEGPVDPRLLAGVRVLCAPTAAALGGKSGIEQLGRWDAPIALAAELAALRTLTGMCAIALSQFKGILEDDQALLAAAEAEAAAGTAGGEQQQQPQLSADQQLAVQFRMGKKQLLLEALGIISRRIKQLASSGSGAGGTASGGGSKQGTSGGSGGGKGKVAPSKKGGRGFGQ